MRQKYIPSSAALLLSALLAGCGGTTKEVHSIHMDFQTYTSAEDMMAAADTVLIGTVTAVRDEVLDISLTDEPDTYPYHIYTLQVAQVIKGNAGSEYEIKVLGGEMDGEVYSAAEEVEIEIGGTYLIATEEFYEYDADSYPSLLNYEQACVSCEADASEVQVIGETLNIQSAVQQYGGGTE